QCGTTDRARLSVAYSRSGGGASPPSSIFVKVTPTPARTRLFVNLMHLGQREVDFYRRIAPHLGVERPRVFHAQHDGRGGRFVLVCEDLVARGARFVDAATPLGFDEARTVVRELARLHASLWGSPRLERDLAWLSPRRGGTRRRIERFARRVATDAAMRSFGDLVPAALPARIVAMRGVLERAWFEPP